MLAFNRNKIIKISIIMILILNLLGLKSFALVSQTRDFYVADYANLIDEDVEEYIIETNKILYSKTGAQIVVVTVPNLEGKALEEYATALFRKFGIGDSTKNNGVLMLLALEERQFRIEVGYGLEGVLTDGKTGRIQDEYIIPYLKQDNWNDGIKNGYCKILEEVSAEYNVEVGTIAAEKGSNDEGIEIAIGVAPAIFMLIFGFGRLFNKKLKIILLSLDAVMLISLIFLGGIIPSGISMIIFIYGIFIFMAIALSFLGGGRFFGGGFHSGGGFSSGGGSFGGGGFSGGGGSSRSF